MNKDIIQLVAYAGIGGFLAAGAYTDYKTRTIPNWIPIGIATCGLFTGIGWIYQLAGTALFGGCIWAASAITKKKSGGGDIKTYLAMVFSCGMFQTAFMLALTIACRKIVSAVKKPNSTLAVTTFPMCCYLAPAYALYWAVVIGLTYALKS